MQVQNLKLDSSQNQISPNKATKGQPAEQRELSSDKKEKNADSSPAKSENGNQTLSDSEVDKEQTTPAQNENTINNDQSTNTFPVEDVKPVSPISKIPHLSLNSSQNVDLSKVENALGDSTKSDDSTKPDSAKVESPKAEGTVPTFTRRKGTIGALQSPTRSHSMTSIADKYTTNSTGATSATTAASTNTMTRPNPNGKGNLITSTSSMMNLRSSVNLEER